MSKAYFILFFILIFLGGRKRGLNDLCCDWPAPAVAPVKTKGEEIP